MPSDFAPYARRYAEEVGRSIGFVGQDVEFFTEVKALRLLGLARRRLGDPHDLRALDVGCGVGLAHALLASHLGELHGLDLSPEVVDEARRANAAVHYHVYGGSRFPFPDDSFDLTFAICVVHHVEPSGREGFLRELRRVTRPQGLAVVFEHNPLNPLTRLAVSRCEFDQDAVLLRRRTLAGLLARCGIDVVEQAYILFFPWRGRVLRSLEERLPAVPLGAQYYVAGTPAD